MEKTFVGRAMLVYALPVFPMDPYLLRAAPSKIRSRLKNPEWESNPRPSDRPTRIPRQ